MFVEDEVGVVGEGFGVGGDWDDFYIVVYVFDWKKLGGCGVILLCELFLNVGFM